jgi:serine/threonine protein kinase
LPFCTNIALHTGTSACSIVLIRIAQINIRDIKGDNILMDPKALGIPDFHFSRQYMNRDGSAPVKAKYRRTERWPRYYLIDFGFSSQYAPEEMPPSVAPLPASDPSLPELAAATHRFDPFPSDVYYIGNWIRMELVDVSVNPDVLTLVLNQYTGKPSQLAPTWLQDAGIS